MPFVKLDCDILESSLWDWTPERHIFLTALLMAKPHELKEDTPTISVKSLDPEAFVVPAGKYGLVKASGSMLIKKALCLPLADELEQSEDYQEALSALEALGKPDQDSRSLAFDGRRLVRIDGGYIVLNFQRYRDKDHTATERKRRQRDRERERDVTRDTVTCHSKSLNVTQAEAEAEAEEEVLNNNYTIPLAVARLSSPSDPLLAEGETPEQGVWRRGAVILMGNGSTESSARSLLGKLIKTHGEEAVAHAVTSLELKHPFPADPKAFLIGCLKPKETSYTTVRNQPTQREAIREEQERIAREIANA